MGVVVIRASQQVVSTGRGIDFKLVKDAFVFVEVAQLLLHVVGHVDGLDVLGIVPDVPEFDGEVVSGHEVVFFVREEGRRRDRADDFGEEVLFGRVDCDFELGGSFFELGVFSGISEVGASFGR